MKRSPRRRGPAALAVSNCLCVIAVALGFVGGFSIEAAQRGAGAQTLFEGARLISGDGGAPLEGAAVLVDGDTVVKIGKKGEVQLPTGARRVDLTGKTMIPGLVAAHGHVGYLKGTTFS